MITERLNKEQIRGLLDLCLQNAVELIEEADILFRASKYARAAALAIIAMEELGKRTTLFRAVNFSADEAEWRAFWKRFRRHEVKIGNGIMEEYYMEGNPELFEDTAKRAAQAEAAFTGARENAFYVDMLSGSPSLPSVSFTERKARTVMTLARKHIEFHYKLQPTDPMLMFAEKVGNRKRGETHRQWAERVFGKELQPAFARMVDEYDRLEGEV